MASAKKLQHKIFGAPSSSIDTLRPSPSDPGLTISIPKPTPSPSLAQPKKQANETPKVSHSAGVESTAQKYRDPLTTQLESECESVERHRLAQDQRRERHWKRWGPYLSERQWVRNILSLLFFHHFVLRCAYRPPFAKTTQQTVTPGPIFPMHMPDLVHTDGGKTASLVFAITISVSVFAWGFGMASTPSSRSASSVSLDMKATTAKTAKSSTTTSIQLPPIRT